MRLISWNVNGLRSCLGKGFLDFCAFADADVICLQETKMRPEQAAFDLPGYHRFWNSADKAGYSGTAIFTRREPLSVTYDFGPDIHRHEGRVITAEYEDFYLVCCYTPNSKDQLSRLDYRMEWEDDLRDYLMELDQTKPVVYCGDLNVAHQETDLKNPKPNRGKAGFLSAPPYCFVGCAGILRNIRCCGRQHPRTESEFNRNSFTVCVY